MTEITQDELSSYISIIRDSIKQVGWSKSQVKEQLEFWYGKDSLLKLDDDDLIDFMGFIYCLATRGLIKFPPLEFRALSFPMLLLGQRKQTTLGF